MLLNNQVYSILKAIAQVWLPALGVLYAALAAAWHFPAVEQVSATILAIDTFLGVVLHLSTKSYNSSDEKYDGELLVERSDEGDQNLRLKNVSYDALNTKNEITLRLLDPNAPPAA